MNLLSVNNDAKTSKGEGYGVLTGILYLAPSTSSGWNVCPNASAGCIAACLNTAGRGVMSNVQRGRLRKTQLLFTDKRAFFIQLEHDIRALVRKAEREGLTPAVRLNGTSDLPWERMRAPHSGRTMMETFPGVQFYDYTKDEARAIAWARGGLMPANYDLTFSRSETNEDACVRVLAAGGRVAMVYSTRLHENRDAVFANAVSYGAQGFVDGDTSDIRFHDPHGVVVALRAKGRARTDSSGFVIR